MKTSFKSMTLIGAALVSAMGCYTISLKVSAERAAVERTRSGMTADLADIRLLQAELRTRARLPELQRWNEQVLALAPPRAEQFLGSPVMLASYAAVPAAPAAPALAAPAVQVAAIVPAAPPASAPVRQVAYAVPAAAVEPVAAAPARPHPTVVASLARHDVAQRTADIGLDAAFAGSIASAAAAERSGFQRIALR